MVVVVTVVSTRIRIAVAASEEAAEEETEVATIVVEEVVALPEEETEVVAVVDTKITMTKHQGCNILIELMRIWVDGELVAVLPATSTTTTTILTVKSLATNPNNSSSSIQETEVSVEATVEATTTSEVVTVIVGSQVASNVVAVNSSPLNTSRRVTIATRSKHQDHLSHPALCSSLTCLLTTQRSKCSTSSRNST
jgi:hypothetical protein